MTAQTYHLDLAGQHWTIEVPAAELARFYRPLLGELLARAAACPEPRYVVYFAAAPGAGKTTLTCLLQRLGEEAGAPVPLQPLPMDGFHRPNAVLDATPIVVDGEPMMLRKVKGCPESYDQPAFLAACRALRAGQPLRWPRYDRQLHDPVPDAIPVIDRGICLVEGNYLLLDEPGWRELAPLAHRTYFLDIDEATLRGPTVQRHIRGGRTPADAERHFVFTDLRNRNRLRAHRLPADVTLHVDAQRRYHVQPQ